MPSKTLFLFFACFNAGAAVVYSLIFLILKKRSKSVYRSNVTTNVPKIVIDPGKRTDAEVPFAKMIVFPRVDTSAQEDPLLVPSASVKMDQSRP